MKQIVPPVYPNGYHNPPLPTPAPPSLYASLPQSMLPPVPPGPPIYRDPGPGPYPWPGSGRGSYLPSQFAGHYPVHDFYQRQDTHPLPTQYEALLNLLANLA